MSYYLNEKFSKSTRKPPAKQDFQINKYKFIRKQKREASFHMQNHVLYKKDNLQLVRYICRMHHMLIHRHRNNSKNIVPLFNKNFLLIDLVFSRVPASDFLHD
jgi:hypothetical protein